MSTAEPTGPTQTPVTISTATDRSPESGLLTPTPPTAATPWNVSELSVVDTGWLSDWVQAGRPTSVVATVANRGDSLGFKTLNVTVDGAQVAEQTVVVQPGERRSVLVEFEATPGTVAVDGTTVGQLTVSERYGVGEDGQISTGDTTAGFGAPLQLGSVVALLALAGVGVVLWRRRR
jgi:hypothetical protein